MMDPVGRLDTRGADPVRGRVVWDPAKIAWFGGHAGVAALAPFVFTPGAVVVFLGLSWLLLLLGHSVGYHRLLMHGNIRGRTWLERTLIYCGVLLGAAGPSAIIRVHDERDWAQRAPECHPYYSQHNSFFRDMAWQMFARLELDHPPRYLPDARWGERAFIIHLDRWWRVHALLPAIPLYLLGGLPFVVWGVSVRITAAIAGHWAVNHLCHHPKRTPGGWEVPANGVRAHDLLDAGPVSGFFAGLVTVGECWHNTHHAFPESANVGLGRHHFDPGYQLIRGLRRLGWITHVRAARSEARREDVTVRETPPRTRTHPAG